MQLLNAFDWGNNIGQPHAVLIVNNDDFAVRDQRTVDEYVHRRAGILIERYD